MSKIDVVLKQYCSNGVPRVPLGSKISLVRGSRLTKNQLSIDTGFPVYQNSLKPLGYHSNYNTLGDSTFVICAGAAGEVGYSADKFWAADDCFVLNCPSDVSPRYMYHVLLNSQNYLKSRVRKASIPRLSHTSIELITIPLPPLEVQEEIVRILDSFTALTAELTAELTARKKQYEFYRDKLLSFDNLTPEERERGGGS